MRKTPSQIVDEVTLKMAAPASLMRKIRNPFRGKTQQYVQPHELAASMEQRMAMMGTPKVTPEIRRQMTANQPGITALGFDMSKLAQGYYPEQMPMELYQEPEKRTRVWPYAVGGAALGGLGAHYALPSQMVQDYREAAKKLREPAAASLAAHKPLWDPATERFTKTLPEHMWQVRDVSAAGKPSRFVAPAHTAQKYLKSRAFAEAMPRTLLGAGLGLGAGILGGTLLS